MAVNRRKKHGAQEKGVLKRRGFKRRHTKAARRNAKNEITNELE